MYPPNSNVPITGLGGPGQVPFTGPGATCKNCGLSFPVGETHTCRGFGWPAPGPAMPMNGALTCPKCGRVRPLGSGPCPCVVPETPARSVQQGWLCPACGKVYAPFVSECSRCKPCNARSATLDTRPAKRETGPEEG